MERTTPWGDLFAIAIQHYRATGRLNGDQPLIRIDYREEAANAPFQFDPVRGTIHRTQCQAIPSDARSAIFARWRMQEEEAVMACLRCRPKPRGREPSVERNETLEVLYGIMSILGQFGTLLRERGKEFRNSEEGKQLEKRVEVLYANLDEQQKRTLEVVLLSLDQLIEVVRECDKRLQVPPHVNGHGSGANGSSSNGKPPRANPSVNRSSKKRVGQRDSRIARAK
jgi:hypothetical protein